VAGILREIEHALNSKKSVPCLGEPLYIVRIETVHKYIGSKDKPDDRAHAALKTHGEKACKEVYGVVNSHTSKQSQEREGGKAKRKAKLVGPR